MTLRLLFKRALQVLGILTVLILIAYVSMAFYINANKKEVLQSLTAQLNENINGSLTIGSMEPAFLRNLPRLSLNLKNVVLRDSAYPKHQHTFLKADDFYIAVNALALLSGSIEIKKIDIQGATVDLFTDEKGYSNGNIFKKSNAKSEGNSTMPELSKFSLQDVEFAIDNRHKKKLFRFYVKSLDGNLKYTATGFDTDLKLKTLVKSMAFSTDHGSFLKEKMVEGNFDVVYTKDSIVVKPNRLDIGGENFTVSAGFQLQRSADFAIHVKNDAILWKNASRLLSPNISSRLDLFGLQKPIAVTCDIVGDFNAFGDPLIHVKAKIRDNVLQTSGGIIENCHFDGEFTNNNLPDKGFNDANSAVKLFNFSGNYAGIPIAMKQTLILNFEHPIAVGDFSSEFEVNKLSNIINKDLLGFSKGTASVKLNYQADIVNYEITKPKVAGTVSIKNANVNYEPRNLKFNDISVLLHFKNDDLFISNIHLRSGKSEINMEGNIKNLLNLYYTAPEKIVVNWKARSPQLHLDEFLGFAGKRKTIAKTKKRNKTADFTAELSKLFDSMNVNAEFTVDHLFYQRFHAKNVTANLFLNESGINLKNAKLQHAGGSLKLNGYYAQQGKTNPFRMNAEVYNVDISRFFDAFKNFGLESLQAKNLKGYLSANTNLTGRITDKGEMVSKSMHGSVDFGLKQGRLLAFSPVKSVGKFAFPFRNFDTISFYNLKGKFDIAGEKVNISPMQINSSILNMDVEGLYSFGKGTQIYVTVPLRNPKKDKGITDEAELAKRRNRGILLRLIAADGNDGKVKISLGKKEKE